MGGHSGPACIFDSRGLIFIRYLERARFPVPHRRARIVFRYPKDYRAQVLRICVIDGGGSVLRFDAFVSRVSVTPTAST